MAAKALLIASAKVCRQGCRPWHPPPSHAAAGAAHAATAAQTT